MSIIEIELAFVLSNVLPWASTSSKYISFPQGQLVKCLIWGITFILLNQLMTHDPNWASHLHTCLCCRITSLKANGVSSPFAQKLILLMVALVSLSIHPMLQGPVLTFLNHHGQAPRSKSQNSSSPSSAFLPSESQISLLSVLGTSREPRHLFPSSSSSFDPPTSFGWFVLCWHERCILNFLTLWFLSGSVLISSYKEIVAYSKASGYSSMLASKSYLSHLDL